MYPTILQGKSVKMRGSVISVPLLLLSDTIPASDELESPYIVQLIDGSTHSVSPRQIDDMIDYRSSDTQSFSFPSWLGA